MLLPKYPHDPGSKAGKYDLKAVFLSVAVNVGKIPKPEKSENKCWFVIQYCGYSSCAEFKF